MYFTLDKAARYIHDLKRYIYEDRIEIRWFKMLQQGIPGAEEPDFDDSRWTDFEVGSLWGGRDETAWFRATVEIPESWKNRKLALYLIVGAGQEGGLRGSEALLYVNGEMAQGLGENHREVCLRKDWISSGRLVIAVKAFSGLQPEKRVFRAARLVCINGETEDLYFRADTILQALRIMKEGAYDRERLTVFLNQALNILDFRKPGSSQFYDSVARANDFLREQLKAYKPCEENKPVITAVGHSHIDVAWLWQLKHTREKCARTFSTVNHLMSQYPEYIFLQSTPQLYEYVKQDYPSLYDRIKENIRAGKWEVTGGMWVEADCNIPSGESLVRQFLFGTRYMRDELGAECSVLWLPDVFGYSWALPQIIAKSGLKYFMTTKISWSQYNRSTYDTFRWRGLDGTEVLTHFITTTEGPTPRFYTYNGMLTPASAHYSWGHYQQKDINDELLLAYGFGDGGGGPTKEMIETGRKMQELPVVPQIRFGKAEEFFDRLAARVEGSPKLPVVDGELYLEYHRGTYTSQARTKKNNRKCEILLHNVELYSCLAGQYIDGFEYPQREINDNWKIVLRNQFHDILAGSSIHEVYEDADREYAQVLESGNKYLERALYALASNVLPDSRRVVVFNPLSWERGGLVRIPWADKLEGTDVVGDDGSALPARVLEDASGRYLEVEVPSVPPLGYKAFAVISKPQTAPAAQDSSIRIDGRVIDTPFYRIELNAKGQIASLYDKEAKREVIAPGQTANVLQAFEDRPMSFDAWDIDLYYQEKQFTVDELDEFHVEQPVPDQAVVRLKWRFLDSTIEQRIVVYAKSRRIDFRTDVDWHEHQILLKVAFPVDIRATKATYEIQYGCVERPTHWNTSWDYAKFESIAHKWADLSEQDYGVSLLNDCKYGYDIKDNVIRLTLIKSGIEPDPEADQGHHSFTYSIYPHKGNWFSGRTTQEAYELNYELLGVYVEGQEKPGSPQEQPRRSLPSKGSLAKVDACSTILDTVKWAEDDSTLILRFYEFGNRRDSVTVEFAREIDEALLCDLMERPIEGIECAGNRVSFTMKPYEIRTMKVALAEGKL
jgi:alpha-mannosidase